jgi:hypothetical protein
MLKGSRLERITQYFIQKMKDAFGIEPEQKLVNEKKDSSALKYKYGMNSDFLVECRLNKPPYIFSSSGKNMPEEYQEFVNKMNHAVGKDIEKTGDDLKDRDKE